MQNTGVKLAVWLLKRNLSIENRGMLINCLLDTLQMVPLKHIIKVNEDGSLNIRGKNLNYEEMNIIRESAKALKDNRFFGLIQDEVLYRAFTFGLNHSTNFDQIYASKMAIWWGMEENKLINLISDENPDLSS